ncbi:MAG: hypothetical protein KBC84_07595 [Proteobacteria bacterium]|nr:hypothetical protein [Pseudomonadota bacterium]
MKKIISISILSLLAIILNCQNVFAIRPSTAAMRDSGLNLEYSGQTSSDEIKYFVQQKKEYERALADWRKEKEKIEKEFYAEKEKIRKQEDRDSRSQYAKSDRRSNFGRSSNFNWDVKSWFSREPSNQPEVTSRARYSEKLDPQKILSSTENPPIKKQKIGFWGHMKRALGLS